jgi:toxin-antitoxin system PIN domain toxin
MSIALLDVNVLVALFDPAHRNHEDAHRWFGRNRRYGWATCPITINGCIRVLSNPAYPIDATAAEVIRRLTLLCSANDHHFWADTVTLLDDALLTATAITGHRQVTDVYLLGLAVRNHARLATFDRSIPLKAIRNASAGNLAVIETTVR